MFCITCGLTINIATLTLILDASYKQLKDLSKPLEDQLLYETKKCKRQKLSNLIREIEQTGPFNGNGYFEITKSPLTGMVSIGITYVIILVQFKMSVQ
jgi:Txe/YoeB family toxin of Txe-Axe toxin-antitoxin module